MYQAMGDKTAVELNFVDRPKRSSEANDNAAASFQGAY